MRRLNVYLEGGLGNQLFQFANAYALSKKMDAKLRFDTKLGFIRDRVYNRKYELYKLNIEIDDVSSIDRIRFVLFRFISKILKETVVSSLLRLTMIEQIDRTRHYNHQIETDYDCKWVVGSWQSPNWFLDQINALKRKIVLCEPYEIKFLQVYNEINVKKSAALCLRFYEESPEPGSHSSDNSQLNMDSVFKQARHIKKKYDIKTFYVFTSNDSFIEANMASFNELGDIKFISVKNGFVDSGATLWLLSKFRYYIITNSTFYWWGAVLSSEIKKVVYASENFLNRDIFMDDWILF